MRWFLLITGSIFALGYGNIAAQPGKQPDPEEPPPLHEEKTAFSSLRIREYERVAVLRNKAGEFLRHPNGEPMIARRVKFREFHQNGVLFGKQIVTPDRHVLDDFMMLCGGVNPWDAFAVAATIHAFDSRQEPLTYYHQSGPVGAIFTELRSRKNGADRKAPVGVVGLQIGTQACYALPGQKMTFYETDPALKRLVADTDKYFTHITDARKRGAEIDVRVGKVRDNLEADKDRKFALVFVDQCETYPRPKDRFTVEAVRLYFDRMADDGILALHVSSRDLRLDLVASRIAAELGLAGRVWSADDGGREGVCFANWVILARKPEHLGKLLSPFGDLDLGQELLIRAAGHGFRKLETHPDTPLWTDAKAEVVPPVYIPPRR